MTYRLICMSFDGEYVTEEHGLASVDDAWRRSNDMGSRWFFYPFHFVTTASGLTIVASPHGMEHFDGRRVTTVQEVFKLLSEDPEMVGADTEEFGLALQAVTI